MKCCVEVSRGKTRIKGIGFFSRCNREGTIERNGRWYCFQHDPNEVQRRAEETNERRQRLPRWKRCIRA